MIDLRPLGDRAVLARFATEAEAAAWADAARGANLPGVLDVGLAYATAAVYGDPDVIEDWDAWADQLRAVAAGVNPDPAAGRLLRIPTWYGGEDLDDVARAIGATPAEVVALHSGRDYRVFAVGFQPGFPYAGYLPDRLAVLARRPSPRAKVPAGSVAIAGRQTGIYPGESPGGWHLLGRTPCRVVDLAAGFFPIEPGDRLRFEPIEAAEFDRLLRTDLGSGIAREVPEGCRGLDESGPGGGPVRGAR